MEKQQVEQLAIEATKLAKQWQDRANQLLTNDDRKFQTQISRLLQHPSDKVVLTKLMDRSFRSADHTRTSKEVYEVLKEQPIPEFFSPWEKLLIGAFLKVGRFLPDISVPKMIDHIREFSNRSIIGDDGSHLGQHLAKRREEGVRMNLNRLGEAVLGEEEARRRFDRNIADLKNPSIEYISVKVSTIYSQISALAFEHSVEVLQERLGQLYQAALDNEFQCADGTRSPKFVNLDMEEYHDLEITVEAFRRTLSQEKFKNLPAGIVLQAYLPDSYAIQMDLTHWAMERLENGGSAVKVRIVKGANLEMEQVESALHGWPVPTYDNKTEVDSNYKRLVIFGMEPQHAKAVHLGIASHNLFELAFAYLVADHNKVLEFVSFEMLEGMADHVRKAISDVTGGVLLYAPVVAKEDFINAIAYLIRRLDENTAPDNFLRYASHLMTDSPEWSFLKDQFFQSCQQIEQAQSVPNRQQDRNTEVFPEKMGTYHLGVFENEPDTDFSLPGNRNWAEDIRKQWKWDSKKKQISIPIVIAGKEIRRSRETVDCLDPSQYNEKIVVANHALANDADIAKAVATAKADPDGWRSKSHEERHEILSKVAQELRQSRGDLIGAAAADTGKLFTESDVEVSEAIDFTEYYPHSVKQFLALDNLEAEGKGVGLVVSPWNFPIAIPCGGIVASLAAGNTVIFKPSPDSVLVAWELCQRFWKAGISKNVLQFMPYSLNDVTTNVVTLPEIDFVILTGGTKTGMTMLRDKPDLFLSAETGGKNATIVTAMADRDQALKNVVYSAFGNTGQKCSATSLLILEKEIFDEPNFKKQLVDATQSYKVGSAWDFENKIGTLIRPPSGALERALSSLEPGETWLLEPTMVDENPYIWTPGIKWGVTPGTFSHQTEFFGPVLSVLRADNLSHAIRIANQVEYGLTSAIESLDEQEQALWKSKIEAGNLYVNRGTTGAIALRQPFGGIKKSALGPGIKAGSPNYVSQFMNWKEVDFPKADLIPQNHPLLQMTNEWRQKLDGRLLDPENSGIYQTTRAIRSCLHHLDQEFSKEIDYFHLRGQDNLLRYRPLGKVLIRLHEQDNLFETLTRISAASIAGNQVMVSAPEGLDNAVVGFLQSTEGRKLLSGSPLRFESDEAVIANLNRVDRIRYASPERVPQALLSAAAKDGFYVASSPVLMEGRLELLHYMQNQSISDTYHRYGNLGERAI